MNSEEQTQSSGMLKDSADVVQPGWLESLVEGEGVALEDNADVAEPGWLELLVEREGVVKFWFSPACARLPQI